jgi:hypothetical protein
MAIYHLHLSNGSKIQGASGATRAAYVMREQEFAHRKDELVYTESAHMPEWAKDAQDFWRAADLHERANARVYREVEIALPRELNREVQVALAREFAQDLTRANHLPYTLAVHDKEGHNPHAHLLFSERRNDGVERDRHTHFKRANSEKPWKGGAPKVREMRGPEWVKGLRTQWEVSANTALEQAKRPERIDARSYEAQGVRLTPQIHLGVSAMAMAQRGVSTERLEMYQEIKRLRALESELERVTKTHAHLQEERRHEPEPKRASLTPSPSAGERTTRPDRSGSKAQRSPSDTANPSDEPISRHEPAHSSYGHAQAWPRHPGESAHRDGRSHRQSMESAPGDTGHSDQGSRTPSQEVGQQDTKPGPVEQTHGVRVVLSDPEVGPGDGARGRDVSRGHVVDETPRRDQSGVGGGGGGQALQKALESFNRRRALAHPGPTLQPRHHSTPPSHTSEQREVEQPIQKEDDKALQMTMDAQRQQLQVMQVATRRMELDTLCKKKGWLTHSSERPMRAELIHKEEFKGSQLVILKTTDNQYRVLERPQTIELTYNIKGKSLETVPKHVPLPEKGSVVEWRNNQLHVNIDNSREQRRLLEKVIEKSLRFSRDR